MKDLGEVSGYVGKNITLPSSADPSWVLSRIDWSIFPNNTWIATYDSGHTNVERRPEYKGRLTLNITSGDLTIQNLRESDAMEYTVDLLNKENENKVKKIRLKVKKPLQEPTIELIQSIATDTTSVLLLSCSSPDVDVDFSWKVQPSCRHYSNSFRSGTSELVAVFQTVPVSVNVTCIAKRQTESKSKTLKRTINRPDKPPPQRCLYALVFFSGFIVMLCFALIYNNREKILKHYRSSKGNNFHS